MISGWRVCESFQIFGFNFEANIQIHVVVCVRVHVCIFWSNGTFEGTKILDHFPNHIVKVYDSQIWVLPQSTHLISVEYHIFNQTRTNAHTEHIVDSWVHKDIYVHAWCNYCLWKWSRTVIFQLLVRIHVVRAYEPLRGFPFGLVIWMQCLYRICCCRTYTNHKASRRRWWYMNIENDKNSTATDGKITNVWVYLASWERNFLSPSLPLPLRMGFTPQKSIDDALHATSHAVMHIAHHMCSTLLSMLYSDWIIHSPPPVH